MVLSGLLSLFSIHKTMTTRSMGPASSCGTSTRSNKFKGELVRTSDGGNKVVQPQYMLQATLIVVMPIDLSREVHS
jgi:hypothetical protein